MQAENGVTVLNMVAWNKCRDEFKEDDDPVEEHRKLYPQCLWVTLL